MAKGKSTKATKATKAKSQVNRTASAQVKTKRPASVMPPSKKKSAKPVAVEPKAPAPAATQPVVPGLKKRNVKRGAPPMLPRRMVRRPDPVSPGSGPPAPRPPSPAGSLHAPARSPEGAEGLKQRLGTVMSLIAQLKALKRSLNRQFFDAGLLLQRLSEPALFQAKGYGTFESFIEREIERELAIGRGLAHDLVQIVRLFQRDPAEDLGLDKLRLALRAIWPESTPSTASAASSGAVPG